MSAAVSSLSKPGRLFRNYYQSHLAVIQLSHLDSIKSNKLSGDCYALSDSIIKDHDKDSSYVLIAYAKGHYRILKPSLCWLPRI